MATEMAWNQLATDLGCITSPHTVANIMGLKNRQVFLPHSVCVWCVCVCVSVRPSVQFVPLTPHSSVNQSSGSTLLVIWGCPLIHDSPGRLKSIRSERKLLKGWACWAPLLNWKSDLSVRNGVLLYKQLIRPVMDYACHAWRSPYPCPEAAGVTIQVSSPCYWCPWYVSNRQIHEDLGVPLFADHIRALTASFDSKLTCGTLLYGNSADTQAEGWPRRPTRKPRAAGASRPRAKSTKRIAFGADQPSAFRLPWLRFPVIYLSCKANSRVYDAKFAARPAHTHARARALAHARTHGSAASPKPLKKSHTRSLRLSQSGLRTQPAKQSLFLP